MPLGPSYPRWLSILVPFFAKDASHSKHFTFSMVPTAYQAHKFSNLSGIVGTSICRWKKLFEYGWRLKALPNDKYNKGRCLRFLKESRYLVLPNSQVTKQEIQNIVLGPWELIHRVQKCCERLVVWVLVSLAYSTIEVAVGRRCLDLTSSEQWVDRPTAPFGQPQVDGRPADDLGRMAGGLHIC